MESIYDNEFPINKYDFKYTKVFYENLKSMNYDAPHHFKVRDKDSKEVIAEINFQEGPIKEVGVNGVMNEELLSMIITRLEYFQQSKFACSENALALEYLELAMKALKSRTIRREQAGIEGTIIQDPKFEGENYLWT